MQPFGLRRGVGGRGRRASGEKAEPLERQRHPAEQHDHGGDAGEGLPRGGVDHRPTACPAPRPGARVPNHHNTHVVATYSTVSTTRGRISRTSMSLAPRGVA